MFTVLAATSRERYDADGPTYINSFDTVFEAYQCAVSSGYAYWLIECETLE